MEAPRRRAPHWRLMVYGLLALAITACAPLGPDELGTREPLARGGAVTLSAGPSHTCGVTSVGGVACWGDNSFGQLGDGTTESRQTPVHAASDVPFESVSAGQVTTCAVSINAAAFCWGHNSNGELGDGTNENRHVPTPVAGGLAFRMVAAGGQFGSCGLTLAGHVYCWGSSRAVPTRVEHEGRFVSIALGGDRLCALTSDGERHCKSLYFGDLPMESDGTGPWQLLAGGGNCLRTPSGGISCSSAPLFCAVDGAGAVDCWKQHGFAERFRGVAVGADHQCAVDDDGAASCAGENESGQLGDGSQVASDVPVRVLGTQPFVSLSAGLHHSCALASDAAAYCWGARQVVGAVLPEGSAAALVPMPVAGGLRFRKPPHM